VRDLNSKYLQESESASVTVWLPADNNKIASPVPDEQLFAFNESLDGLQRRKRKTCFGTTSLESTTVSKNVSRGVAKVLVRVVPVLA
jgi:hypothetical protein